MRGDSVVVWSGALGWVDPFVDSTVGETGPVVTGGSAISSRCGRRGT